MSNSLLESLDRLIASAPKAVEAKKDTTKCKKCGKSCTGKLCKKCESQHEDEKPIVEYVDEWESTQAAIEAEISKRLGGVERKGKHESIESMIDEKLRKMCGKPEHEKWPIHAHGKKSHKKATHYPKLTGGGSIPGWGEKKHEDLDERRKPGQCFKTVRKALGKEHKGHDKDALAAWIKRKNIKGESTRDRVEHTIDQLMS